MTSSTNAETNEPAGMAELRALRARMLPMFEAVAREYATRTEPGYPLVFDNVEDGGFFGIHLEPGYGLYIMTDGQSVFAQINIIGWRTDVRSSANKEKFAGLPFEGVRPVSNDMSDSQLRNLIAELLSYWNTQPLLMNHTDS
ncbi:MAG: hypothetical protein QJR03_10550 [Sphaerobacter sp.]|nr:hypothetical protein [Sphaerobacter sp.]